MEVVTTATELSQNLFLEDDHGSWQLRRRDAKRKLPGQPRIQLANIYCLPYFRVAHLTVDLDRLIPYIQFLGLATPTHTHISPLHHQTARQRTVIVVESPRLHLIWQYNQIYIKPIPEYMLSSAFWKFLEKTDLELWRACAGFMRTYYYLIQYQIDFERAISTELGLIPKEIGGKSIGFEEFVEYIEPFASLGDDYVNPRFTFGELRLTRLNILTRLFLWKATYFHTNAQWPTYLGKFLAPFLVLFAVLSTVLSAMQVGLAVNDVNKWHIFAHVSWWFAIIVIISMLLIVTIYLALVTFMLVTDFAFAKRMTHRKKYEPTYQQRVSETKSGVV